MSVALQFYDGIITGCETNAVLARMALPKKAESLSRHTYSYSYRSVDRRRLRFSITLPVPEAPAEIFRLDSSSLADEPARSRRSDATSVAPPPPFPQSAALHRPTEFNIMTRRACTTVLNPCYFGRNGIESVLRACLLAKQQRSQRKNGRLKKGKGMLGARFRARRAKIFFRERNRRRRTGDASELDMFILRAAPDGDDGIAIRVFLSRPGNSPRATRIFARISERAVSLINKFFPPLL